MGWAQEAGQGQGPGPPAPLPQTEGAERRAAATPTSEPRTGRRGRISCGPGSRPGLPLGPKHPAPESLGGTGRGPALSPKMSTPAPCAVRTCLGAARGLSSPAPGCAARGVSTQPRNGPSAGEGCPRRSRPLGRWAGEGCEYQPRDQQLRAEPGGSVRRPLPRGHQGSPAGGAGDPRGLRAPRQNLYPGATWAQPGSRGSGAGAGAGGEGTWITEREPGNGARGTRVGAATEAHKGTGRTVGVAMPPGPWGIP